MDLLFRILIPGPGPLDSLHRMTASSNCLTIRRWWNLTTLALNLGFCLSSLWTLIQCLCMKEDSGPVSLAGVHGPHDPLVLLHLLLLLGLGHHYGSGGKGTAFHNTVSFCVSMTAKQERHSISRYVKLFWVQETFSMPLLLWV